MSFEALEQKVKKSVEIIKARALISNIIIGLSGGKDSMCLCELTKMAGVKAPAYFNMEFLPGLRIQRDMLEYPCRRFGIDYDDILKVPSEHYIKCMHCSAYTWYSPKAKKTFPNCSRTDVFKSVAGRLKGTVIVGTKKADGITMTRMIDGNKGVCLYPMADWTLKDVLTFMEIRKIKIPELTKKGCRGVGLEYSDLKFISENYPDDYEKIQQVFPFAPVIIKTVEYYNLHKSMRIV